MINWLDCLRSRKQPNATVQNGFSHSVACMMAARAYWSRQEDLLGPERRKEFSTTHQGPNSAMSTVKSSSIYLWRVLSGRRDTQHESRTVPAVPVR